MPGLMFRVSCLVLLLIFGVGSCQAQTQSTKVSTTLSNCRPPPSLPANVKPGVGGMTLSRDGKTLAIGGGDGKIRFVDVATGEIKRTFTGHTNAIYKPIFSPDEKLLASSGRDLTA